MPVSNFCFIVTYFQSFCICFLLFIFFISSPLIFGQEECGRGEQWLYGFVQWLYCFCTTSWRLSRSTCRSEKQPFTWIPELCAQPRMLPIFAVLISINSEVSESKDLALSLLLLYFPNSVLEVIKSSLTGERGQLYEPSTCLLFD